MVSLGHGRKISTLFALLILSSAVIALGQAVTGTILGRVTDSTGAVVAGASVQIQNTETGLSRTEQADSEGRYSARNLPLGSYSVTVQQAGFQTAVRRGIVLTVASEVAVNVELAVGNVQEKVEVTAEAPVIETTNATISSLVGQEELRELPLNGRSVDTLTLLNPGVLASKSGTPTPALGFGLHISANGARPDAALYLIDGTVMNDNSDNGSGSAAGSILGVEGILEFRMLTHNFSAEYGRNSGAVVSMVTRSGTNGFHGSLFEFMRNNIFDARNFFNQGGLPPYRRNQFGAAAGGPIRKDKIFFFANYEGLRTRQGVTNISGVPDENARKGLVPDASGKLQSVTLKPAVIPYLALWPLPNSGINYGDGTGAYVFNFNQATTEDYGLGRVDVRLSDKDNFYVRYVDDPSAGTVPRPTPNFQITTAAHARYLVLSETHILSGSSLNDFRFSLNRTDPGRDSNALVSIDPSLSFVPGQAFGDIKFAQTGTSGGTGSSSGLAELGNHSTTPHHYSQNLFDEADTFTTVRGAHSLKFGVDFQRVQENTSGTTGTRGVYTFGGLTGLLAGTPTVFTLNTVNGFLGWRQILFGWFVQDDLRLRPNLTINLGFRHEFYTSPTEVNGRNAALIHITDAQVTPGVPFISPKKNFSPRVGMAWDPTGSGKTSVRLGAGFFYNELNGRQYTNTVNGNPYTSAPSYSVSNPAFPNQYQLGFSAGAQSVSTMEYHLHTPTVVQYNLEVQRQLTPTLSLRVGYIGSAGYHMTRVSAQNIRLPLIQPDGSYLFTAARPKLNPNFSTITYESTDARYNYNGFQTVLQKTLSVGLQLQASYTYSKAMSNSDEIGPAYTNSVVANTLDPWNPMRDYSLSAYDQRQTFVLNGAYQLPLDKYLSGRMAKTALGGWAINGIFSYGSGLPFGVADGFNNSLNSDTTTPDRPNLLPGFSNNPIQGVTTGCQGVPAGQKLQTPTRWFDPCAFALSPAGTYGNVGRVTLTSPGGANIDFTLIKNTQITERTKLEFRAEFFNLFNHAHFSLPNLTVFASDRSRSGSAGSIISTISDNREIQFGMKFIF